jgi:energy-coupling factor transporter transmembrane protein EcfT
MLQLIRDWIDRHFSDPQILVLGFMLVIGFVFIIMFGDMLIPVFASIVIAYLLDGMVVRLARFKVPRMLSVLIVFLVFLACLLIWHNSCKAELEYWYPVQHRYQAEDDTSSKVVQGSKSRARS